MQKETECWRILRATLAAVLLGLGINTVAHGQSPISGATRVVAGDLHTCALVGGGVKCWGYNGSGQLGDNTTDQRLIAVDVVGLANGVKDIAAASGHNCALTTGGGVKCWGNNGSGQLGDSSTTQRLVAVDVIGLTNGVSGISAGQGHTCALTTSGGVKCWGSNGSGQLGDGSTTQRLTAVDVPGLTSGVVAIAAGAFHTCALTTGGGIKCWGNNGSGQLGDGSTAQRLTAVDVSGLTSGVVAIATGVFHTCARTAGGGVKCWGANESGQLGDNSTLQRLTAVDVTGLASGVAAIATGGFHVCAMTTGGGVKCWGNNNFGQLGDDSFTQRLTAVDVAGLTSGATAIAAGGYHACVLTTGGVKCWGRNGYGELGDNSTSQRLIPVDVRGLTSGATAIAAGQLQTCILTTGSGVKCWGNNAFGQLGDNSITQRVKAVEVVGLANGVMAVAAGASHTCVRTTSGGVKCWGNNGGGQLGDNSTTQRLTAVDVSGLTSGVAAIAAGADHTCARTSVGGVKCWGNNGDGQLGDNSTIQRLTAVDVSGLTGGVAAVTAGARHTCALTVGGGVKCWGNNGYGQIGDNSTTQRLAAVDVSDLTSGVVAIAAGAFHTCALTTGGGVKCWGINGSGQLGDNSTDQRLTAVGVIGLTNGVTAIGAGNGHTCALTTDGGVKCWGYNGDGQLGDNSVSQRPTAVDVQGMSSGVAAVSAGGTHTCALTSAGGVKCWGENSNGQVGDGTFTGASPFPVVAMQVNTAPGAPTAVSGAAGNSQINLAWVTPASNGGPSISGYNVQMATSSGGTYADFGTGTCAPATTNISSSTTCTAIGLTNGATYYFKVAAINGLGMGGYSSASSGVSPSSTPPFPPPPDVPTLPVTLPGVVATPGIANLMGNDGQIFLSAITNLLNNALGVQLQFVEQASQGTIVMRGYQGGNLAFVPFGYQTGDARANGIYALGDGRFQVVNNGASLTIAPALRSLDQLVALLPGMQVVQSDNGVLTAYFDGVAYVVQPSVHVASTVGTGSARLVVGSDGYYHFIDAQGNEQILYPAFREPNALRAALQQVDPSASMSINLDGTTTAQLLGRSWLFVPDFILVPVSGERLGQAWWQETSTRYRYTNNQRQPVSGMSQGLTVR